MILKDRMKRANPIWRRIVRRAFGDENKGFVMVQAVAGGAAGFGPRGVKVSTPPPAPLLYWQGGPRRKGQGYRGLCGSDSEAVHEPCAVERM